MRSFLSKLLLYVADQCTRLSSSLDNNTSPSSADRARQHELECLQYSGPYDFKTFREGMLDSRYMVRLDAARKLVGWYVYYQGQPMVTDLVKAAETLLEDYVDYTNRDRDALLTAWEAQAIATSEEEKEEAYQKELDIFNRLVSKK